MNAKERGEFLEQTVARLAEHFEVVSIMVSGPENGGTYCHKRGCGNWYARIGMCHEMIESDKAQEAATQIGEKIKPAED